MLGESQAQGGNYLRGFDLVAELKKATPQDIHRVAKNYLKAGSRSVVVLRPEKKSP